jgi:hypothetical protein
MVRSLAISETADTAVANMAITTTIGATTQRQTTVIITIQVVLDFFSVWIITGALPDGGGAEKEKIK